MRAEDIHAEWNASRHAGLALFSRYVKGHAFIHDDHWMEITGDVDEMSGHPLLLGAPLVVTGRPTRRPHLTEGPQADLIPKVFCTTGPSPLSSLVGDSALLETVAKEIAHQRLDISSFYSDRAELQSLQRAVQKFGWDPSIHPDPSIFVAHSDHISNLPLLQILGKGLPATRVCATITDVVEAFTLIGPLLFCKTGDSKTFAVDSRRTDPTSLPLPCLLQRSMTVSAAPTFQWIHWDGESRPLFVLEQIVEDAHHRGNRYSRDIERSHVRLFRDIFDSSMSILPQWQGVLGVDYLLTEDAASLIPIDLNARFNSSTIPFAQALIDHGEELESALYLRHEVADKSHALDQIDSLSRKLGVESIIFGATDIPSDGIFFSFSTGSVDAIDVLQDRLLQLA